MVRGPGGNTTSDPEHRPLLGLLFRLLAQRHGREVDAALRKAGFADLRPPHANVFPFVPREGIQIGDLASQAGVRKQSMAQSVDELVARGYLETRTDPSDRRARLVFLTPKGEAIRPIGKATGAQVEAHWADLVGPDALEDVRSVLARLLDRLRAEDVDTPQGDRST
jgi:DNA-binding MarR family transcriptional regulator